MLPALLHAFLTFPRAVNICVEDTANFFDHDIEPLPTAARPDF